MDVWWQTTIVGEAGGVEIVLVELFKVDHWNQIPPTHVLKEGHSLEDWILQRFFVDVIVQVVEGASSV